MHGGLRMKRTFSVRSWGKVCGSVLPVLCALAPAIAAAQTPTTSSFSRDVAPILAQCMQCHGQAKLSSNLDLRTSEGALKGGMHGPVIVSGDAAKSHVYRRITAQESPRMPYNGAALSVNEIE